MQPDRLIQAQIAPAGELRDRLLAEAGKSGGSVRFVRGRKAATAAEFFNEISAALQFPDYFSENWDALNDCVHDLAWLPPGTLTIVFIDADRLLAAAPVEQFATLKDLIEKATATHGQSKRPARPLRVILHAEPGHKEALAARWPGIG